MSNLVGQQISHYQIKALLGTGRIGTVYQAVDLEDLSLVALKTIYLKFTEHPDLRLRFLQEVKSLPRLNHPSIINLLEAGIDTDLDLVYLTTQFVPGRSLSAHLQQLQYNHQVLSLHEALTISAQIAEALGYAHQKRLIHRDVRPDVILFKPVEDDEEVGVLPGRASIGDFTLVTILEQETELFKASLPYAAPEYFLSRDVDGRSDIYSLGIILYQLVTGRVPFVPETMAEAERQHAYQTPPTPRSIRPDLPDSVEDVILKAIDKNPEARFQTGVELARVLRQLIETVSDKLVVVGEEKVSLVKTTLESPELLALSSQWSVDQDRVTITRDMPRSLNRQIITIGRGENNDIVLPETSITRQHAQLERTQGGWQIRDLGSQNGTFLDGKPLLPDIPESWETYQTLRIGPYFLQLQLGKGYEYNRLPFFASALPDEIELQVGKRSDLQVLLHNESTIVDEFTLEMERVPTEWYTLPSAATRLKPGERRVVKVPIHPPFAEDTLLGTHRYLIVVHSKAHDEGRISVPGTITVLPPEEAFSLELLPSEVIGKGRMQLFVRNEGLAEGRYDITSRNVDKKLRFSVWQPKEAAESKLTSLRNRAGSSSGKRPSAPKLGLLNRLPIVRRIRTAPRQVFYRVQAVPRRFLNNIMPGLGTMVKVPNLSSIGSSVKQPKTTQRQQTTKAQVAPPTLDKSYEKVVFPAVMHTQVQIPAGKRDVIQLEVAPRKRPLWGRQNHTIPFDIEVHNSHGREQTVAGKLEVKPRLRSTALAVILAILILFVCAFTTYGYLLRNNPAFLGILNSTNDRDEDGLSNLIEVYVHQTDPNDADSDNDTITDGAEIAARTNPRLADTDGDRLNDAVEQSIGTNPRLSDTDGDSLSDGLEVLELNTDPLYPDILPIIPTTVPTLTPEPTVTAVPTLDPAPLPTDTPSAIEMIFTSEASEDGHIVQEVGSGRLPIAEDAEIQIGEGENDDRQYKGFLSFDTSDLPENVVIETAVIRLYRSTSSGVTTNLGELHLDVAPEQGFNNNWALENEDFSADADVINVIVLNNTQSDGMWIEGALNEVGRLAINRRGATQFRMYFTLTNDSDGVEDWVRFYAGDYSDDTLHPQLVVVYTLSE